MIKLFLLLSFGFLVFCCQSEDISKQLTQDGLIEIKLPKPWSQSRVEYSGLDWYGDRLILLPQYPDRFDNQVISIKKNVLLKHVNSNSSETIGVEVIDLVANNLYDNIPGFQGIEAVCFFENEIFLTVEAKFSGQMMGYLVKGKIDILKMQIELESQKIALIKPQRDLKNYTEETLLYCGDTLITIFEANGQNVNPQPIAHRFSRDLDFIDTIPFPNIEFRITDATRLDSGNRVWVINYLWPGDFEKLKPNAHSIYHTKYLPNEKDGVERLLALTYTGSSFIIEEQSPITISSSTHSESRNWEGLARLDDLGFLIISDFYPTSILAFLPHTDTQ